MIRKVSLEGVRKHKKYSQWTCEREREHSIAIWWQQKELKLWAGCVHSSFRPYMASTGKQSCHLYQPHPSPYWLSVLIMTFRVSFLLIIRCWRNARSSAPWTERQCWALPCPVVATDWTRDGNRIQEWSNCEHLHEMPWRQEQLTKPIRLGVWESTWVLQQPLILVAFCLQYYSLRGSQEVLTVQFKPLLPSNNSLHPRSNSFVVPNPLWWQARSQNSPEGNTMKAKFSRLFSGNGCSGWQTTRCIHSGGVVLYQKHLSVVQTLFRLWEWTFKRPEGK